MHIATEENARKALRIAVKEEALIATRAAREEARIVARVTREEAEENAHNCMPNGESEPSAEAVKRLVLHL